MGLRWRQNGKEPKGNIGRYDEASWAGSMLQVSLFACEPPRRGREEEGRGITFLQFRVKQGYLQGSHFARSSQGSHLLKSVR